MIQFKEAVYNFSERDKRKCAVKKDMRLYYYIQ